MRERREKGEVASAIFCRLILRGCWHQIWKFLARGKRTESDSIRRRFASITGGGVSIAAAKKGDWRGVEEVGQNSPFAASSTGRSGSQQ
jgi:hypothetical protein